MDEKLKKPYSPKDTEDRIYKLWEESGFFNPDICVEKGVIAEDAEAFSIVLPPPNATGVLHLGHALENSMQDTMIRYHRMRGYKTLWLPGTDHAAIATDSKVTKILEKEGLKKKDIGREKFLERVDEFVADSRKTIQNQLRKMGSSLDWSREAFTLDKARNIAVNTVFEKMYEDGLIYRENRIVNWDPKGQTVISDDEIVYEEHKGKLYTFRYSKEFPIPISTTRPETKIGDTAVAVHPDGKWKKYIGQSFIVQDFCGEKLEIKIVGDEIVDQNFGTGAIGVTPAHSLIDWEIAKRHGLKVKQVINEYAKISVYNENLRDKKTTEAREIIIGWLKERELLENEEDVNQNIATAERTSGIIEPIPKIQWFVDVNKKIPSRGNKSLKELMLESIRENKIKILPEHFEKVYFNWIENLRDWCISRQIWYGHRIPVFYDLFNEENKGAFLVFNGGHIKDIFNEISKIGLNMNVEMKEKIDNGQMTQTDYDSLMFANFGDYVTISFAIAKKLIEQKLVTMEDLRYVKVIDPHNIAKKEFFINLQNKKYLQDPDTLDTWFSSGLWSFSTLGWPEKSKDLKTFHPTSVINPGYEILFFWVARMILMSQYLLDEVPFKTVYLHGMLRDAKGQKFSKSIGNGVDPIEVINEHGADALRMSLIVGIGPGMDSKFDIQKVKAYSKFSNKIWNAARFVLENTKDFNIPENPIYDEEDKASDEELKALVQEITKEMDQYKFYIVAEKLYHYFWHTFADIIIERSKKKILEGKNADSAKSLIYNQLKTLLITLHPFMPFVTEEIWSIMPNNKNLLIITKWPSK